MVLNGNAEVNLYSFFFGGGENILKLSEGDFLTFGKC